MHTEATMYAAWLTASGWLALVLARVAWKKRSAPGALALVGLCLCLAQWTLTYALHWISPSAEMRELWLDWTFVGVVFAPVTIWLLVMDITRPGYQLRGHQWTMLLSVGVITTFLLLLGDPGGLVFGNYPPGRHDRLTGGPWFTVLVLHSSVLIILSGWRLIQFAREHPGHPRRQATMILFALGTPFVVNQTGVLGFRPFPGLDMTPMLFMLTAAAFLWAVLGLRLFDVVPIARHQVVEQMSEGVVVLDENRRLADMNGVARRSINPDGTLSFGTPAHEVFHPWPGALPLLESFTEQRTELETAERCLDVRVTPLLDRKGRHRGQVVVWRDVTEQRHAERALQLAHQELQCRMRDIEALQEKLQEQSIRDPLTGLYNRRHLERGLSQQVGQTFSVILLDIDHFKAINDTFGHAGGDEALLQLSDLLTRSLAPGQSVYRYGGEEFLLLLPGSGLHQAAQQAEHLRRRVASHTLHHDGQPLSLTISLGVASCPECASDADAVLLSADKALYAAKAGGRNRVQQAMPLPEVKPPGPRPPRH